MTLTNADIVELTDFRRALHRQPELSNEETETAAKIVAAITPLAPDRVLTNLGGHGVAIVFNSAEAGPTVLIRSETDALPIQEISDNPWTSEIPGKGHLCGHDGHSSILTGVARVLARRRPKSGRAILMFQPAEETGDGAYGVIADPRFTEIAPDYSFALHNMPGLPLGYAALVDGLAACASRGLKIVLTGKTSHSSMPQDGVSPMAALASLMPGLTALAPVEAINGPLGENFRLITVTHCAMGEQAFGVAPGGAELWATLRTMRNDRMADLCRQAEALAARTAADHGLSLDMSYHEIFEHCDNHPDAVALLRQAFDDVNVSHGPGAPMRASEDFGLFGKVSKSAMFYFGSGENHPQLHNPDFDFPDDLIEPGVRIFSRLIRNILG